MPFDLESARKEASDKEISDFLASKVNFDIESARKESSDTEIANFLAGKVDEGKKREWSELPEHIIPSAKEFASNIITAVAHPIRTVDTIRDVVLGGIASAVDPIGSPEEETFNQVVDFFKDRYGSVDKIKETAITDPVGFASDVSLALSGVGATAKVAGEAGKISQVAKAGEVISKVGRAVEPVAVVGKGVETLAKLRKPTHSLVKTALQLPKKKGIERIDELSQAFVDKGLNVNRKSLRKLDTSIKKTQKAINNIVDKKTTEGYIIKTTDIVDSIDELISNANREGLELPDIKMLERMRKDFIESHGQIMTPRQVQDLKIGFNKGFKADLESRYGQVKAKFRDKLRDTSRSELEKMHPELRELNKGEGIDLELNKAIKERIIALEKAPTIPSKGLVAGGLAGGAAGASTESLGAGIAFAVGAYTASEILSSPRVQVVLAKALNRANIKLAKAGKLYKRTVPAFQAGRIEELKQERPEGSQSALGGQ